MDSNNRETLMPGELIYQYRPQVVEVVEFGIAASALFSGATPPPAEGGRLDLYLEGPVNGPKLSGTLKGVDYLSFARTAGPSCTSTQRLQPRRAKESHSRPAALRRQMSLPCFRLASTFLSLRTTRRSRG